MIRVLHFRFTAVLGRYPFKEIRRLFALEGIEFLSVDIECKDLWKKPKEFCKWCNENKIDWVYWGWEKENSDYYKELYESDRKFKILLFGQEQPQALNLMRDHSPYADVSITSSPIYKEEVNGFFPFGIHTYYFEGEKKAFEEKKDAILLSGTYRKSRGQFFDRILKEQPFDWPVYLFPPRLHEDLVGTDEMRKIAARYPKYVYQCAPTHDTFISRLMSHLNEHKLFLDFTTNSSNYLKFHEDLDYLCSIGEELPGGYCPERVLDALWLGTYSYCFKDKAVEYVLGENVGYYGNIDELVERVNEAIRNKELQEKAKRSEKYVERYTTEEVIKAFTHLFKTDEVKEL